MPTARITAKAGVVNGKVYVIGGKIGTVATTVVERYDPETDTWDTEFSPGVPFAPYPCGPGCYSSTGVHDYACATLGTRIYCFGGNPNPYKRAYAYDTTDNTWTRLADLPRALRNLRAAALEGYIYLFGGCGAGGSGTPYYKTVYRYDPENDTWARMPDMPMERTSYALTTLGSRAYLMGGIGGDDDYSGYRLDSLLRCDHPEKGRYTELAPLPEPTSSAASVEVMRADLYVMGGTTADNVVKSDVYIYSPDTDQWQTGPFLKEARREAASAIVGDTIYVFGGRNAAGEDLASVETLRISTPPNKAIIVAGGGASEGNTISEATRRACNRAFKVLLDQGLTKEKIFYLSPHQNEDLDQNGLTDEVDAFPSRDSLFNAVTQWASDGKDLVLFLFGHGDYREFALNDTERLTALELKSWLDDLQASIPGLIVVVYDGCRSGSFLEPLVAGSGVSRMIVTSTSSNEVVYYPLEGTGSFSYTFWTETLFGSSLYEAFDQAGSHVRFAYQNQYPLLDANGNGAANETGDALQALNYKIGKGIVYPGGVPLIGRVSPEQTLEGGETSCLLYRENIQS